MIRQSLQGVVRPRTALLAGAVILSGTILAANVVTLANLRENALRATEANLRSQAIVLAEEGDRSLKVLDFALSNFSDSAAFEKELAGIDSHRKLNERRAGIAHADTISLIGASGRIVSSSSAWPVPDINVADRDHFRALAADPTLETVVSAPILNRSNGMHTIYLARRLNTPDGEMMGLIVGGITVKYFESFFRSIALQDGRAVSLIRRDGTLLARYPTSPAVGKILPTVAKYLSAPQGAPVVRVKSPIDNEVRLTASRELANYPLAIFVSQTEESALSSWRSLAHLSSLMAIACAVLVQILALKASRWWRRQEGLTQALKLQNMRFDIALANMSQGLCVFDAEQRVVIANDHYAQIYGLTSEQVQPGTPLRDIVAARIARGLFAGHSPKAYLQERTAPVNSAADTIHKLSDGRIIAVSRRPMQDGGWVTTHEDITERHSLTTQLAESNTLLSERSACLQAIVDNFPGGISFLDNNLRMVVANGRLKEMLDFPEELFANGPPPLEDLFRFNARRGEYGEGDVERQVADRMTLARSWMPHTFERTRPDGTVIEVRGVPIPDGGFVTTYMDVTARHTAEARIAHVAHHDALTELPNRVLLRERLLEGLSHVRRGAGLALLYLDLDRFKEVNDTLGHTVGDELLRVVAERLRLAVRNTDLVARLGGDEFAILQYPSRTPEEAAGLAERLLRAMGEPFMLGEHRVEVGTSIGIARAPADGVGEDELVRAADLALYQAKYDQPGTYRFFEPLMNERVRARSELARDLRHAAANGGLELHFQPLLSLQSDAVCTLEALVRWNHPQRGLVLPGEFIPIAEENGLICSIGEWVLHQACAACADWPKHIRVALNLSAVQIKSSGFVTTVAEALTRSGLAPDRLELELTESVLASDIAMTSAVLRQLREFGVKIVLDDFGTGYSSLNYLRSFPFDKVKVDRCFVRDVDTGAEQSLVILRSIISLARGLGIATTAEGIETPKQLDVIRAEGFDEVQGYLISRPKPILELADVLAQRLSLPKAAA